MKRLALLVAVLVLAGCGGSRTTQVGAEMILPPMAPQMKMQSQEAFFMAEHLNPELLPDYPAALLETGPEHATVCAEIVVDADGAVSWTAPLRAGPRCPAEALPALAWFEHAVDATVRQWRFDRRLQKSATPRNSSAVQTRSPVSSVKAPVRPAAVPT